ncbi:MAG: LppX_LprAFG lipoprotein [Acidimicrobiia bacterium]
MPGRTVPILLLGAVSVLPAACGNSSTGAAAKRSTATHLVGSPGRSAARRIAAAADATAAMKSMRISLVLRGEANGESQTLRVNGVMSADGSRGRFTANLDGRRGEMLVVDGYSYVSAPSLGDRWYKTRTSASASASPDPTSSLDALRGVSSDVAELGHETIHGTDTTHYRADLDLRKAADRASDRFDAEELRDALGSDTLPADVWIARDGTLRRIEFDVDATLGSVSGKAAMTFELYDFGVDVGEVRPPPADRVVER